MFQKVKFLISCLLLLAGFSGAEAQKAESAVSTNGSMDFSWAPYALILNEKSYLNHDNYLQWPNLINQTSASFWYDVYFGEILRFSGQFKASVNTRNSTSVIDDLPDGLDHSTLADVTLGFDQIYLDFSFPNYWTLGYGKFPVRNGFSRIYSPFNYTARTLNFLDEIGQWNAWFKGNFGPVNFSLYYFPSIQFKDDPNDKTDVERFFSSFETPLERQTWALSLSFFLFNTLDTNVFINVQDKSDYEFSNFYLSTGVGFSWSILSNLIWRGELILGNGYDDLKAVRQIDPAPPALARLPEWEYVDRATDTYYPKVLTGLTFIIPGNIEVTTEYYYNGAGLTASERKNFLNALQKSTDQLDTGFSAAESAQQGAHEGFLSTGLDNWKIFELGQHYAFLQIQKLGLFQRLDIFNTSIMMIEDFSFFNITTLTYSFSDRFSLSADCRFFAFQNDGIFRLSPEQVKFELMAEFSL